MNKNLFFNNTNNKGMALVATLIFVFTISTLGIALLTMTSSDIKSSSLQEASKETFYIAESGLERAISYLENLVTPNFPSPTNPFADENGGSPELGKGQYTVTIESTSPMSYIIISTGKVPWNNTSGKISTTIESKVQLENFAMYAYFSDNELFPSSIDASYGGSKIWFYGDDTIGGKLHSNDRLHIAGSPTFNGAVTSAWVNPTDPSDVSWEAYDAQTDPNFNGSPPYQGGVDEIPLPAYRDITDPTDPKSLQRIAAGSESLINTPPAGNGTYLPDDGSNNVTDGIWVNGDVDNLILGTDAVGNSKITIDQYSSYGKGKIIYKVETPTNLGGSTYSAGTTVVYDGSTYTPYNGYTNGLLYVNGEIKSLKGTAADGGMNGKITIASNNDIVISNDLLFKERVDDPDCFDDPYSITDSIGLVSEGNIRIASGAPTNIEINGVLMALGTSFYYDGWKSIMKGDLTVHGSFIQKQRGPVGTFNSWGKQSGYTKDYIFDTRMSIDNPNLGQALPPYFPTTGKYIKQYWKEL
jgi:hypothetical protein